jgi:large subunit ribosomal protein L25
MERVQLEGKTRKETGKGPSRRLREAGWVPVVVYGPHMGTSLSVAVSPKDMKRVMTAGDNVLVDLRITDGEEAQTKLVMVKECVHHPTTERLWHVDLYEVSLQEAIRVDVPLAFTGDPEGVVLGGTLSPLLRSLEVSCLPEQIPHEIEVDCSALRIGGMIYVKDIHVPEDLNVLTDSAAAVVTVMEPGGRAERPAVAEEEAPPAEEPKE